MFIYALRHPLTLETRYIGKTDNLKRRLKQHLNDKRKAPRASWIKSLKAEGLEPEMILLEVCSGEEWKERERYWIEFYRATSRLTNLQNGGEGNTLSCLPEATREAMSASHRRRHAANPQLALQTAKRMKGNTYSRGQAPSERQKESARLGKHAARFTYKIYSPEGEEYTVTNLSEFCREHQLNVSLMSEVTNGNRQRHKGYTGVKL